ncbi:LIM domain-containing protein WLIM2b-like [Ctenocephalides felis]|uniref:LIM domain-containing protein WLIM2b-like n=1 Tax=Ctenocephalides felis TaxID=7515 RepID=UPI000E6E1897|nr:LIM domain-containing protein WLIM2b-like [Ctenocephalides felis]
MSSQSTKATNSYHHQPVKRRVSITQFDMKSSFNKFDALQKKSLANSKSSSDLKSPDGTNGLENEKKCKGCSRVVFQMEQIKAENRVYHKNCFRCKDCNKQLTVDTYESHESELYCKPHFKALFAPKVIEDSQPKVPRKHEMIIRENQPMELPPDVVRGLLDLARGVVLTFFFHNMIFEFFQ